MRPKILHLITGLDMGGAEKALARNISHLTDFEHIVCSLSNYGEIGAEMKQSGHKVYALKSGKYFSLFAIWRFRRVIRDNEPELLITYLIHADIFGRVFGRLFGIKKIISYLRSALVQKKYFILFFLELCTSFLVNKYIAVSNTVKMRYIKKSKISPKKIVIIPNSIDPSPYIAEFDKNLLRKKLDISNYNPVIGCVAKLRPEKNHDLLLKSFALYSNLNPRAILLLIGDGPEKGRLTSLAKSLSIDEKVIFMGNRHNIPELLQIIDIFIILSSYEGMSNALLEAMAAGCPIIASDIPPNRELITHGKNGYLVNSSDKQAISHYISVINKNPDIVREFKKNSTIKIEEFFIENTTVKLSEIIHQLLAV